MRYSSQSIALNYLKGKKAFLSRSLAEAKGYLTRARQEFENDTFSLNDNYDDDNGNEDVDDDVINDNFEEEDIEDFDGDIDSDSSGGSDDS